MQFIYYLINNNSSVGSVLVTRRALTKTTVSPFSILIDEFITSGLKPHGRSWFQFTWHECSVRKRKSSKEADQHWFQCLLLMQHLLLTLQLSSNAAMQMLHILSSHVSSTLLQFEFCLVPLAHTHPMWYSIDTVTITHTYTVCIHYVQKWAYHTDQDETQDF